MSRNSSKSEIIELINDEMNFGFLNTKIGDIRENAIRFVPTDYPIEYDDYSVLDFIIFLKIDALYNNNIISEVQMNYLKELYNTKLELNKKIKLIVSKDLSSENDYELVHNVTVITNTIHQELAKFGIISKDIVTEFSLEDIINKSVKNNDYSDISKEEELKKVLEKVKQISPIKIEN